MPRPSIQLHKVRHAPAPAPLFRRCISRSPNAPADCQGEDCNVFVEEWGIE